MNSRLEVGSCLLFVVGIFSGCDAQPSPAPVASPLPPPTSDHFEARGILFGVPRTGLLLWLPASPESQSLRVVSPNGNVRLSLHSASTADGLISLSVAVSEYPDSFLAAMPKDHRTFVEHASDEGLKVRIGSKLISRKDASLADLSGIEEETELPAGQLDALQQETVMFARRRHFRAGNEGYLFQVMTLKSAYDENPLEFETTAKRFFDSIELVPSDKPITDGFLPTRPPGA